MRARKIPRVWQHRPRETTARWRRPWPRRAFRSFVSMNFLRLFSRAGRRSCAMPDRVRRRASSFDPAQPAAESGAETTSTSLIRNLGVAAHIDAGKTTTTERMLLYCGFSRVLGNVDDGDTVMDYTEQERDRGITITAAAITFGWRGHFVNLVDTPGHVDFTVEVERALRVLDGAVAVLDAAAGVEAQTLTIWRQADRYQVPRIVYLNKMDKANADVQLCLGSLREKLKAKPLLVQLPLHGSSGAFSGVVDLPNMEEVEWLVSKDPSGKTFVRRPAGGEEALAARQQLVEQVVDLDERLAEAVLSSDRAVAVSASDLESALRRITVAGAAVPVFCGSSYKNVGVQALLDAVVKYLPSPADRVHEFVEFYGSGLCALVFKIIHDKHKGRLTFLRLYSGKLEQGQRVYNAGRKSTEKTGKLYVAYADEFREIKAATSGSIVVVTGLTAVFTGDTLVSSANAAGDASRASARARNREGPRPSSEGAVLAGVSVPKPVFFCSIEPASLMYQTPLEQALECIKVEDPSFTVKTDPDTRQTIIGGMGELHIDIVKDRLLKEFKVEADLGPLQVAYQETLSEGARLKHAFERSLGKAKGQVLLDMSVEPQSDESGFMGLQIGKSREARENAALLQADQLDALEDGSRTALTSGPLLGYPVANVSVWLHWCQPAPGISRAMLAAAAAQCVRAMLKNSQVRLLEPVMALEIATDPRFLHNVLTDLTQRRSNIAEVSVRNELKVVRALTPLSRLVGYSTALRVITSGLASFTLEFDSYQLMARRDQQSVLNEVAGVVSND